MRKPKFKQIMRAVNNDAVFFLIVAFVVSCCMMLFVLVMRDSMGLVFTKDNIEAAAQLTFGNVLLITFLSGTIDYIRRKQMVDRPVKQIMAALITNILKLNKLENQQIFPKHAEYDLSGQLCESLLQFEDAWKATGLNIETEIEDEVRVCSDGKLLSLVWNNLISNAVKFTPAGGTIRVTLKEEITFESHRQMPVVFIFSIRGYAGT